MKLGKETMNLSCSSARVVNAPTAHEARVLIKRYLEGGERRHAVMFQGMSFECFRCGMTATALQKAPGSPVWRMVGEASEQDCTVDENGKERS